MTIEFDKKIPREALEQKQGLDYVSHWYVYTRMNEMFGNTGWTYTVVDLKQVDADPVTYLATVEVSINHVEPSPISRQDVGTGIGRGKAAHENAPKAAVTDALKRAVHGLGQSLGLALYDKQQRYVEGSGSSSSAPEKSSQPRWKQAKLKGKTND